MILLDSSVLIEFFRRSNKATTVFYKLSEKHGPFCISIVTYYEVLVGSTEEQGEFWSEFLKK
ncbi:MAG: PIN domain-containing protein [Ignavibacteriales bacterium]|nr:PIN domain-containing protein [Ignavibacteriales bacterium]